MPTSRADGERGYRRAGKPKEPDVHLRLWNIPRLRDDGLLTSYAEAFPSHIGFCSCSRTVSAARALSGLITRATGRERGDGNMRIIMRGYKNPAMKIDPETILQHNLIGRNSGNLIFSQSAIKALSVPGTEIEIRDLPRRFEAPEVINETFDAMVLPFANASRRGFLSQLREYTELLKRIKVPVTVLGIGAQSDLNFGTDELDSMKEEIKAFVSAALDRGPTVGVRGEFTREYLNSLGFRDVTTIGCPSMFANGQMLSVDEELDVKRDSRIALNATQNVNHGPGFIQRAAKQYQNLEYFPQMLADLELMMWGDLDSNKEESDYPNSLRHPLYADNRSRFFLDAGAWIEYLKDFSFSVGSRIHGNVAALLAGVPAHVLIHDSRTRELAEY